MPDRFEILHKDLAARIGRLSTPHGTIETPVLMPVVNPHLHLIPPEELKEMGADIIITYAAADAAKWLTKMYHADIHISDHLHPYLKMFDSAQRWWKS